jgi:ABC-type xylose transport system permease subunit
MFTKADIEKYFIAEKSESLLFLGIGVAGIIAAVVLFFVFKTNFYKGAATPFLLIGLLLGVVGFNVYKRSDDDRKRNVYAYDMNPQDLKTKELPRMEKVMKNFVMYRYAEIILAIAGVVLFFYFRRNEIQYFWKGFGAALALMALLALAADYFAEKRGKNYIDGIKNFTEK